MEDTTRLQLLRLTQETGLGAFASYLPENFRTAALSNQNLCVGAVFDSLAAGAALCLREQEGWYLRWIYVDPQARYCGLGTYLLRGILGLVAEQESGALVRCILTPGMTEYGAVPGCLERSGFHKPEPSATAFTVPLGDIPVPPSRPGWETVPFDQLPEAAMEQLYTDLDAGLLPGYTDPNTLASPIADCCRVCLRDGRLAGIMYCSLDGDTIQVRCLYLYPEARKTGAASTLAASVISAAQAQFPDDTPVEVSAINADSYAICSSLFQRKAVKETEYMLTWEG